jgi:ubiquinone/menaquinone biosynthesis C-methylase UbiE
LIIFFAPDGCRRPKRDPPKLAAAAVAPYRSGRMGRFATTASLYESLRPPYPAAFFQRVTERLALSKQDALIDLGTGPGLLALGFAPHVGRVTGVDPEPAMLAQAREAAVRAGLALTLIEAKTEELIAGTGRFDIVTIGRALHWMKRAPTLAVLERLLAEDGVLLVCASSSVSDGRNAWLDVYNAARADWAKASLEPAGGRARHLHGELAAFLDGSAFHLAEAIRVEASHTISVGDLARRVLTYSSSSPAALGDQVDAMLDDVAARVAPFARDGRLAEVVMATAQVVRRSTRAHGEENVKPIQESKT